MRHHDDGRAAGGLVATDYGDPPPGPGPAVTIVLRPMASPTSLGLFGLAAATLAVSGLQLGWLPASEGHHAALVLVGFSAVAQLIAAMAAFAARDGVVATAMAVLSLTWLCVGLVMLTAAPGSRSPALGLLLLLSAVAVGLSGATAALSKVATAAVFLTAAVRLLLTGIVHLTGVLGLERAAGVVGLVLFVLAVYVAWASELEEAVGRTVLPVGRRGKGLDALHDPVAHQVENQPPEPGIRTRL